MMHGSGYKKSSINPIQWLKRTTNLLNFGSIGGSNRILTLAVPVRMSDKVAFRFEGYCNQHHYWAYWP